MARPTCIAKLVTWVEKVLDSPSAWNMYSGNASEAWGRTGRTASLASCGLAEWLG